MHAPEEINFEAIKRILPHRYPFLLIDRVLSKTDQTLKALKNVTANEPFFSGHFPHLAVMPGVLQIEAMAQASGLILAMDASFDATKEIAFLAAVEEAKFKKPVIPGDQLIFEAQTLGRKKKFLKTLVKATVNEQVVSFATITLMIIPLV